MIQIIIDWISCTSHAVYPSQTYATHPALHDWENWKLTNGKNRYNQGSKHESGTIALKHSERPDMGTHVIYNGKTIQRILKMYDISAFDILTYHIGQGHNIARIDLAIDFKDTGVLVGDFVGAWKLGYIETRLRKANIVKSLDNEGYTLYIGSQVRRKKLVKIYNKGVESGAGGDWVRCEVQLMGKPATQVSKLITTDNDITTVILRAIKDVVNCPTIPVWRDAFSGREPIKLQSESDIAGNTRKWLETQVFVALKSEISLDVNWWIQYKMALEG